MDIIETLIKLDTKQLGKMAELVDTVVVQCEDGGDFYYSFDEDDVSLLTGLRDVLNLLITCLEEL